MKTVTTSQVARAHTAGYIAASEFRSRAPAQDKTCMSIIAEINGPIGSSLEVLEAFATGYQLRCNEEAEAILA